MKLITGMFQVFFATLMFLTARDGNIALTVGTAAFFITASMYQIKRS